MTKHIAIVEDDPDQRANYCDALAKKGYKVTAYANRPAALEGFAHALPDLVILDIILSGEEDAGFDLCRSLLQRAPELPVLFLTERTDEVDKISGLRLGAWDYLSKPISLQYLAERVASLLRIVEPSALPSSNEARGLETSKLTLTSSRPPGAAPGCPCQAPSFACYTCSSSSPTVR